MNACAGGAIINVKLCGEPRALKSWAGPFLHHPHKHLTLPPSLTLCFFRQTPGYIAQWQQGHRDLAGICQGSSWDLPGSKRQHLSPTDVRSFLMQKGKSASRAAGELIVGGFGFPVRGCIPAGLDGREAGKMLPKQCTWVSDGIAAALLQGALCRAAPGERCVPGDSRCPPRPELLGRLSAARSQEEHPATGTASETAHSSSLPVRQGAPGAGW